MIRAGGKRHRSFFSLPITQENFSEVVNIWYRLVSSMPLPVILTDVNFILRSRPSKEFEVFTDEADIFIQY
jgi:hypothetical protein